MRTDRKSSPTSRVAASGVVALALWVAFASAGGTALASSSDSSHSSESSHSAAGHVYAATNQSAPGNSIVVFDRGSDGRLTQAGTYPTGGSGSGAPAGSGFEQSQNGLILGGQPGADSTEFKDLLFAVNAGSDSITVFRTVGDKLTPVGRPVNSGGTKPTSLTVHHNLLYVLNEGALPLGQGGVAPSITGFRIGQDGVLTEIPGSTRALSGGPTAGAAQVEFDPTGRVVTVTERNANRLDNFLVQKDGTLSQPIPAASSGSNPFGFAESRQDPGTLIVAQGNFPPPTQGGASSYNVDPRTGRQQTISGDVKNGQSDSCWVVLSKGERYAFITNFFSNTVSSYTVGPHGTLTLKQAVAGVTDTTPFGANDEATSGNNREFLYARNFLDGSIAAFKIGNDGTLTPLGNFGAVGPSTGFGLAAD